MSETAVPSTARGGRLWIARNNHRYRSVSFFMVFLAFVADGWGEPAGPTWIPLTLLCLVYPHLVYLRARHAADPLAAELTNLVMDSLLWGAMIATLGFPLWPAGVVWLSALLNSTFCGGGRVLAMSVLAMIGGAAVTGALVGFELRPNTALSAAVILVASFSIYLLSIGLVSHWRYEQLRMAREKVRSSEQALEQQLVEIRQLQERLSEQAIRDSLTGLFNRRHLETIVPRELARRARDGSELALMMIDIDHFKSINDRFGHQGGDAVLEALGALLNETVRGSDVACRFGGEEFLLLLPDMPRACALERAEQWRRAFAELTVESGGSPIRATLSVGVAVCPRDGTSTEELVRAADLALYEAKARGRDRVVMARAGAPDEQASAAAGGRAGELRALGEDR